MIPFNERTLIIFRSEFLERHTWGIMRARWKRDNHERNKRVFFFCDYSSTTSFFSIICSKFLCSSEPSCVALAILNPVLLLFAVALLLHCCCLLLRRCCLLLRRYCSLLLVAAVRCCLLLFVVDCCCSPPFITLPTTPACHQKFQITSFEYYGKAAAAEPHRRSLPCQEASHTILGFAQSSRAAAAPANRSPSTIVLIRCEFKFGSYPQIR